MPSRTESERRIDALLAAYATGTLGEPFAVLVASHLQMRADSRVYAAPIQNYKRAPPSMSGSMDEMNAVMPLALRSYVSRHLSRLVWRTILPGIKQCRIVGTNVSFLRCRPGAALPAHTHEGLEAVLVLQGGFSDVTGHYIRGDVAVADDSIDHRPVADRSAECVVFVVLEAPVKLTGPLGRLIQWIYARCSRWHLDGARGGCVATEKIQWVTTPNPPKTFH